MGNVRIPVKESSLKKKEKIIDVGFRLMCEKGYHNVTCIDIAAAAGVSTGIIYQYFKDKLDIFVAGANKHMKEIMFPMLDILDNVTITRNNFKKVLKQIIEETINVHTLTKNAHQELMSMSCLDKDVFAIFSSNEIAVTEKFIAKFPERPNLKERVHLMIHLIDNVSHEIIYHQHEDFNYNYMIDKTINLIEYMMEDIYED